MKQMACSKLLAVVACVLMLCAVALTPTVADQAQYIYDDLGRAIGNLSRSAIRAAMAIQR